MKHNFECPECRSKNLATYRRIYWYCTMEVCVHQYYADCPDCGPHYHADCQRCAVTGITTGRKEEQ